MTLQGFLIFILVVQIVHFVCTWKLYLRAGRKAWEAAVPVYNAVVLMKIINRPWWYTILLFVPIVNLIMFPVVWVETLRSFGRNSATDTILGVLTLGLYIGYINYMVEVQHLPERSLNPTTNGGEWVSSILFAVVAATVVHTYVMQPFTIPSSSLEKTLLVGDFLFVSKFHYGARTPITPIALPMVHDTIPIAKVKSYNEHLKTPYTRFPGFQKIKHNDIVVFNWPVDTVNVVSAPRLEDGLYHYKPIDKKTNYVKRCVGLPGDSIAVKDGYVYVNGTQNVLPDRAKIQFTYWLYTSENLTEDELGYIQKRFDITEFFGQANNGVYLLNLAEKYVSDIKNMPKVVDVKRYHDTDDQGIWNRTTFPYDVRYPWNGTNFGPIYIPEAGATVAISPETISLYKRIIEVYEGSEMGMDNTITVNQNQVLLNGEPLTEYTFIQDYYWMMGDNRNNSEDARTWGYVPYNHVIGKPVFVWMSWDSSADGLGNKIRWDRVFTTVGGSGEPVSYFKWFLLALAGWFGFDYFRKRKKKQGSKS